MEYVPGFTFVTRESLKYGFILGKRNEDKKGVRAVQNVFFSVMCSYRLTGHQQ